MVIRKLVSEAFSLPASFPVRTVAKYRMSDHEARSALHVHNHLEIGYCHGGSGIFIIGGSVVPFASGDAVVLRREQVHRAQSRAGTVSQWSWAWIDVQALLESFCTDHSLYDPAGFYGQQFSNVYPHAQYPALCWIVKEITAELSGTTVHREAVRGLVILLMSYVRRIVSEGAGSAPPREEDLAVKKRLAPAINHITHHYKRPIALSLLADLCCVSVPHFRRLFVSSLGTTPLEYILRLRIAAACLDLRGTDMTAERVAWENGFPTFSSFLRKFKEIVGTTPHRYRKRQESPK